VKPEYELFGHSRAKSIPWIQVYHRNQGTFRLKRNEALALLALDNAKSSLSGGQIGHAVFGKHLAHWAGAHLGLALADKALARSASDLSATTIGHRYEFWIMAAGEKVAKAIRPIERQLREALRRKP
jgi:hypothetical protein